MKSCVRHCVFEVPHMFWNSVSSVEFRGGHPCRRRTAAAGELPRERWTRLGFIQRKECRRSIAVPPGGAWGPQNK